MLADTVAAYDWSDAEITVLLRDLSSTMAAEVEVIAALDATDTTPVLEAV